MLRDSIQFNIEEFNDVFPFFLLMDENLTIINSGRSLKKIIPDCSNQHFSSIFNLIRPVLNDVSFSALNKITDQLVVIKSNHTNPVNFRGQFKFLESSRQFLFLGFPWFDKSTELNESGLQIKDFAPHNPTIDLLHILKSQEIANDDLKEILSKLDKQKNSLLVAQEQLKKTAAALEESNKRYEFVNKATSEAIWDWDILTGLVYYGDGFQKLFGYKIELKPQNLNLWEQRIHPEDHDWLTDNIQQFLYSEKTNWTGEYRYLKNDGNYAYVVDKGFVIRDSEGHPLRMIGSIQDITKRKEEEDYLKLIESVIKNTNDSVIITEIVGDYPIVFVNEAFTKMTGYTFEEVKGKNPRILQGPKSDKKALSQIAENLKTWKPCEATTINYKKNGEEFWIQFSLSPVVNSKGECTHWISVERDVTASIKDKEEILSQKKFTEDILNNLPTDIAVFDPEHNYKFINRQAIRNEEIREWMIGKNDFDYARLKGLDDTMAKKRWSHFEEAIENKSKSEWIDQHIDENGDTVYKLRIFSPSFENKKLKFVIGYGVDITDTKKAELKIIEALDAIKQSNSELEQFAYVASHDLQEPLRMVTSFLSQLEKKYGNALDDKAKEYIYYAVDGAKRMRQIILDLLEYSRVGKINDKLSSIDLNELIEEIKILHNNQIEELGAEIIKNNLPVIVSYKTPLRQLFQNIISNSLKYHREGVTPKIEIEVKAMTTAWEFTITDNGIGIEEQYFDKIFEIFQRLHNKDEYSGTGIGLAITRKIIDRIGGKIWLTSEYGKGTSFHFTIPYKQYNIIS